MITTIIFDMDGVIVDSEPVHQRLEREMYTSLGLTISEEEHKSYVGTSAVDMWTMISKKHHLTKSPEELLLIGRMQYWAALDNGEVPLVHGVKSIITTFHELGYKLQVASSATRPTVDKVMAHFQLDKYFSHRIGGNEVTRSKPEPEIFIRAAQQSGSAPDRCLVIEDSTNGVKAALQAGMHCIGYANSGTGDQDLSAADLVVNDLLSITPEIISKIQ
jgi:HAD superfamily hydrolase (TIGR01509 family)